MAHLFVDGTAFFGNEATLDNVRCCCYWSPGGEIQWESDWSLNGVCQSSFHGELLAVHRALQARWKVTVYCDCPVVVDCTFDLLSNHDNGTLSNCKCDTEIWHLILQQISLRPKGHVSMGKDGVPITTVGLTFMQKSLCALTKRDILIGCWRWRKLKPSWSKLMRSLWITFATSPNASKVLSVKLRELTVKEGQTSIYMILYQLPERLGYQSL